MILLDIAFLFCKKVIGHGVKLVYVYMRNPFKFFFLIFFGGNLAAANQD